MTEEKLNCVDMSHWGGPLTAQESSDLWEAGIRNIKVGTGYAGPGGAGSLARQQASQWLDVNQGRGGTVDAYIYLYFAGDAVQQCNQGVETLRGIPIRFWWLDAEDVDPSGEGLTPSQRERFLTQCTAAMAGLPVGIYSAHWWWPDKMANSTLFADLPLWNSWYDGIPDESGLPYGGWQHSAVEQYEGTTIVAGQSVDLNFDKTLDQEEEEMGLTAAERAEIDAFKRAVFAGAEQPGDEAARTEYANFKISEGGQSVNDTAESAIVVALQSSGKLTPGLTSDQVRAIADQEIERAHLVPAKPGG